MDNYPGNSRKLRDDAEPKKTERAKVEAVVSGDVIRRKKPLRKRFMENFFGGEDAESVLTYILRDIMLPAAKDMVVDAGSQGIERMFYGESRARSNVRSRATSSYTSYNRMGPSSPMARREDPRREVSTRARTLHDFDEIILERMVEAEEVLAQMYDMLKQYGVVTVADLYELLNTSSNFTDRRWGWTDLRDARILRVRSGFLLDIPKPIDIEA